WLAVMGIVLIAMAMIGRRSEERLISKATDSKGEGKIPFADKRVINVALIGVAAFFALGGVNASIWKQEQVRAEGLQVFIPLAPVDPRSLMQGDYMALRFAVPSEIADSEEGNAYLSVDAHGAAHFVADADDGNIPFLLVKMKNDGRWAVAADAWFFKEGDAKRWEAARYGVFKVDGKGNASLVGMADADLKIIE
ncbi:MAG: GDYXXLXY domain-containing protein, partial [Saezia sp.]